MSEIEALAVKLNTVLRAVNREHRLCIFGAERVTTRAKDYIRETVEEHGFQLIGSGVSRLVFVHEDFPHLVFKYEYGMKNSQYYGGNKEEFKMLQKIPQEYLKYFPECYGYFPKQRVIVFERVENSRRRKRDETESFIFRNLQEDLKKYRINVRDIHDGNYYCFGEDFKEFKIIDFAAWSVY